MKLFSPTKLWALISVLMLVILTAAGLGIWRIANGQDQALVDAQREILVRSHILELSRGDLRAFTEGLGAEFTQLYTEISGKNLHFAIGSRPANAHCSSSEPLPVKGQDSPVTVTICRPFHSPILPLGLLLLLFSSLSAAALVASRRLEMGATRSLGTLLQRLGIACENGLGLAEIVRRIKLLADDLKAARKREIELARSAAIVETAQMVAHDIKRPFATLQMALDALGRETDPVQMVRLAKRLQSEVRSDLLVVDRMMSEISEIGQSGVLNQDKTSLLDAIKQSLANVKCGHSNIEVQESYGHKQLAWIDAPKIWRVLDNIIANAYEAVPPGGTIWIRTKDKADRQGEAHMIEVCIGNNGPAVASGDLPMIFEPFMTKNKRGGTGLGLAIARKIVNDHGGEICCRSDAKTGTEFCFTLPVAFGARLDERPCRNFISARHSRLAYRRGVSSRGIDPCKKGPF